MEQVKQKMFDNGEGRLRLTSRYLIVDLLIAGDKTTPIYRAKKSVIKAALRTASELGMTGTVTYEQYYDGIWHDSYDGEPYSTVLYISEINPKKSREYAMSIGCQDFTLQNKRAIKRWAGVK